MSKIEERGVAIAAKPARSQRRRGADQTRDRLPRPVQGRDIGHPDGSVAGRGQKNTIFRGHDVEQHQIDTRIEQGFRLGPRFGQHRFVPEIAQQSTNHAQIDAFVIDR